MDSIRRTSPLRRVAMMAALAALLAPAGSAEAASKKKKVKQPVVTKVRPMNAAIGDTLTIYGKNFKRGKGTNSVAFRRDGAKAVFLTADVSTLKQMKVVLTDKLAPMLVVKDGAPVATRFQLRVLSARFGKSFTPASKSPMIGPARPPGAATPPKADDDGDCDGDNVKNKSDADDDNDLLGDAYEASLKLDGCNRDTDGDGVEDGYEFQSARDLNDDKRTGFVPYPEARPYANPLVQDATSDHDGDGLDLIDEFRLWVAHGEHKTSDGAPVDSGSGARTLVLNYSDGKKFSRDINTAGYAKQAEFLAHASTAQGGGLSADSLLNMNGTTYAWSDDDSPFNPGEDTLYGPDNIVTDVERYYYDINYDGKLSDDELDEDADGLSNWVESHGFMQPRWWEQVYKKEKTFVVKYAGTDLTLSDTDGDGIRDGADDQDKDDVPNVRELRRQVVAGEPQGAPAFVLGGDPLDIVWNRPQEGAPDDEPFDDQPRRAWVQPFNPCLPDFRSDACEKYPNLTSLYPPFDADVPVFNVFDGHIIVPE